MGYNLAIFDFITIAVSLPKAGMHHNYHDLLEKKGMQEPHFEKEIFIKQCAFDIFVIKEYRWDALQEHTHHTHTHPPHTHTTFNI